jgi:uncharacterized protein
VKLLCPLLLCLALLAGAGLPAAERIPATPAHYFNDYAGVVSAATAGRLNAQLEQFERESSNQLVVAIFPRMESDSSVEDYTVRVAQAWGVGQKDRKNGAVLFAFMQEHKLYLQVGYGLEGVLPDAIAKRIIENELKPAFRAGDYDGGMSAAVGAMIAAAKGEYRGTGRTRADTAPGISRNGIWVTVIILFILISWIRSLRTRGAVYTGRRGLGGSFLGGMILGSGGGGGWSSGGGGGGGFSGGGGSFGGGGAGGSW